MAPAPCCARRSRRDLFSMIFFGPPGCGKTTLARSSPETGARLVQLRGQLRYRRRARRDQGRARGPHAHGGADHPLHRRDPPLQQGAAGCTVPAIEDGVVRSSGPRRRTPTSRSTRRDQPLPALPLRAGSSELVERVVQAALDDAERGLGGKGVTLGEGALGYLAGISRATHASRSTRSRRPGALARRAARLARRAHARRPAGRGAEAAGHVRPRRRALRHHLGVHQEPRGSDPDAAIYYLAAMIAGGEDARSSPAAWSSSPARTSATRTRGRSRWRSTRRGRWTTSGCRVPHQPQPGRDLFSLAPKSNAAYKAVDAALDDVRREGNQPPPPHLRDANYRGAKELGHGAGTSPRTRAAAGRSRSTCRTALRAPLHVPIGGARASWPPAGEKSGGRRPKANRAGPPGMARRNRSERCLFGRPRLPRPGAAGARRRLGIPRAA